MTVEDSAIPFRSITLPGPLLAALGVLAFSYTLPATVFALDGLDPYLIGVGRAAVATLLGAGALLAVRAARPRRDQWYGLAAAGAGVVFGFPVLSSLALDLGASASHSAVVIGLLPAATAVCAVLLPARGLRARPATGPVTGPTTRHAALRAGERPARSFWLASATGALCFTGFALTNASGQVSPADLLLFGALLAAAVGYAEGGRLAREMPGWQVISWALVLTGPVSLPVTLWLLATTEPRWTGPAVAGFAYVSAVSMFLGFFAWYAGLVLACVAWTQRARVSADLPDVTSRRTMGTVMSHHRDGVGVPDGRQADHSRGRILARAGDP